MNVIEDTIHGEAIRIVCDAASTVVPRGTAWWPRMKLVNQGLRETKTSHVLHIAEGNSETWRFGDAGMSLAAGIEMAAHHNESLHDTFVLLPLDTRIYWAELKGRLVVDEGTPFPNAVAELIDEWRASGRRVALLDGGGRLHQEVADATDFSASLTAQQEDITFRHSGLDLAKLGLFRFQDAVWVLGAVAAFSAFLVVQDWFVEQAPAVAESLVEVVTEPPPPPIVPLRLTAAAETGAFARELTEADPALLDLTEASGVEYVPAARVMTLTGNYTPETWDIVRSLSVILEGRADHDFSEWTVTWSVVPDVDMSVPVRPSNIDEGLREVAGRLRLVGFAPQIGTPEVLTNGEHQLKVTATHRTWDLVGMSRLESMLAQCPVQLDRLSCTVDDGTTTACEIRMTVRGRRVI